MMKENTLCCTSQCVVGRQHRPKTRTTHRCRLFRVHSKLSCCQYRNLSIIQLLLLFNVLKLIVIIDWDTTTTTTTSTCTNLQNGFLVLAQTTTASTTTTSSLSSSLSSSFNVLVMERLNERLNEFMSLPVDIAKRAVLMRQIGGFPNRMDARDRDALFQFFYIDQPSLLYYGMEDGTFIIYDSEWHSVYYREPGNSGYDAINVPDDMTKYFNQCVDSFNGTNVPCLLEEGQQYIQCVNNCELLPCQQQNTTNNCTSTISNNNNNNNTTTTTNSSTDCIQTDSTDEIISTTKWCKNYQIKTVVSNDKPMGYVPETKHCINSNGLITQTPGEAIISVPSKNDNKKIQFGNCYYKDEITIVNRQVNGPYAHCTTTKKEQEEEEESLQKQQCERYLVELSHIFVTNNETGTGTTTNTTTTTTDELKDQQQYYCNNTFIGGYQSRNFDPRYRDWYMLSKKEQQPVWTDPYKFFHENEIGITYSEPFYETIISPIDNRTLIQKFQGVVAVDYYLSDMHQYLKSIYYDTELRVLVVESKEPYYVIATSTGTASTKYILRNDTIQPCPYNNTKHPDCDVIRVPVSHLVNHPLDVVLQRAFDAQKDAGFLSGKSIPVKATDDIGTKVYFSQWQPYTQSTAKYLEWHTIVVIPIVRSPSDSTVRGDTLFTIVCMFAVLGFLTCFTLFVLFFRKRRQPAVRNADWRFTSAFILGCSALNLSSLTMLGENTDTTCLLRMWAFNSFFVCALAPLLVKVWRMYNIFLASTTFQRVNVTHIQAFLYTLPFIITEIVVLTIFSFVDRPQPVEDISSGQQTITCQQETNAFFATQLIYDGFLILGGCVLAYKTRDVDPQYGEAKQLVFSMYNIAFTGFVIVLIFKLVDLDQNSKIILQTLAVLWGTFFSSFAFVLPRLIEVASTNRGLSERSKSSKKMIMSKSSNDFLSCIEQPDDATPRHQRSYRKKSSRDCPEREVYPSHIPDDDKGPS